MTAWDTLSASRKADRATMASAVAAQAAEYGLRAVHRIEEAGTRLTSVDLTGPHGLKLTVKFDGSTGNDMYVLSWHGVDEGVRLDPRRFGRVNTHHGHKATDVAHGFAQLRSTLRRRFAAIADGSAFIIGDYQTCTAGSSAVARLPYAGREQDEQTLRKYDR